MDGGSGASAAAFSLRKEIEQGEIKWTNKKNKLKKYSEHLTKHLRLRQRIVFKIKQNTKDKLSQAKWIFGLKTNRSVIKGEAYYV